MTEDWYVGPTLPLRVGRTYSSRSEVPWGEANLDTGRITGFGPLVRKALAGALFEPLPPLPRRHPSLGLGQFVSATTSNGGCASWVIHGQAMAGPPVASLPTRPARRPWWWRLFHDASDESWRDR